jgi:hypothetical protein
MGSSRRVIALFDTKWRALGFFHGRPFVAYPATGVAALAVCGVLVWLIAFRGGSEGAGDVLNANASPTPRSTATAAATRTAAPSVTPSPNATMQAAGVTPGAPAGTPVGSNSGPAAESAMRFKIAEHRVDAPVTFAASAATARWARPTAASTSSGMISQRSAWRGTRWRQRCLLGHVDYHPHYEAVFWDLRLVRPVI